MITELQNNHGRAVAQLHRDGIQTGFLSSLGLPFLSSLYQAIHSAPNSIVLCDVATSGVLGFVAGTTSTKMMYRWVLPRYGLQLFARAVPSLSRPTDLARIWETIRYTGKSRALPDNATVDCVEAELLAIAVDSSHQGQGVGRMLVTALEQWFVSRGVSRYKVVTSASDRLSNQFYLRCGFSQTRSFIHHGNEMNEYAKIVSSVATRQSNLDVQCPANSDISPKM